MQSNLSCAVLETVKSLTDDEAIMHDAVEVTSNSRYLNFLYSRVHDEISHGQSIDPSRLEHISIFIDEYLSHYRSMVGRVLPKHHFLEDHVTEWITSYGFYGMALHGEQGIESLHSRFDFLRQRSQGIVGPSQRLSWAMNASLILQPKALKI